MTSFSEEIHRLLTSLHQAPSLLDRLRHHDPRGDCLKSLAASGESRLVPVLLPFLVANDFLSQDAARAVAALVRGIGPTQLAWIDEQARNISTYQSPAWWKLSPGSVQALGQALRAYPPAIGVLASHPNGFVREAVVNELGTVTDGQEIPFLALRANDWVEAVAAKAGDVLALRLVPENHRAVLDALPFIVRMLGQRRRDHRRFSDAVREVLVIDACRDVLARMDAFDTPVRRFVYELVSTDPAALDVTVIRAALGDRDPIVRRRTVRRLSTTTDLQASVEILEGLLDVDPVPGVRKEALAVLAELVPDRLRERLSPVLLDRAASVRELARFFVRALDASIVPRNIYVENLNSTSPRRLAVAIDGLGETGTQGDRGLLGAFLGAAAPGVRRTALRASAKLDARGSMSSAVAALDDVAPSIRATAVNILRVNAPMVDFTIVRGRLSGLSDPRAREGVLTLLREAPKWDAVIFLLEALSDSESTVRRTASRLLDSWVSDFNRSQTQPSSGQLQRIRDLLDAGRFELSKDTAELLHFSVNVR